MNIYENKEHLVFLVDLKKGKIATTTKPFTKYQLTPTVIKFNIRNWVVISNKENFSPLQVINEGKNSKTFEIMIWVTVNSTSPHYTNDQK